MSTSLKFRIANFIKKDKQESKRRKPKINLNKTIKILVVAPTTKIWNNKKEIGEETLKVKKERHKVRFVK